MIPSKPEHIYVSANSLKYESIRMWKYMFLRYVSESIYEYIFFDLLITSFTILYFMFVWHFSVFFYVCVCLIVRLSVELPKGVRFVELKTRMDLDWERKTGNDITL